MGKASPLLDGPIKRVWPALRAASECDGGNFPFVHVCVLYSVVCSIVQLMSTILAFIPFQLNFHGVWSRFHQRDVKAILWDRVDLK